MIKKLSLGLVGMVLALGSLTACNNGTSYVRACVNPLTQQRVPDYMCGSNPGWYYYFPSGSYIPGYYGHVNHYSTSHYTRPKGSINTKYKAPASGGKVSLTKTKTGGGGISKYFKSSNSGGGSSYKVRSRTR